MAMPDSHSPSASSIQGLDLELEEADHRRLAASCFNHAWTLMEQPDRGPEQNRLLLEVAPRAVQAQHVVQHLEKHREQASDQITLEYT